MASSAIFISFGAMRLWVMIGLGHIKTPHEGSSAHFDIEHLAVAIISAGRTGDVRGHAAATLWAAFEDGCAPAVCATAHFLTAFGLAALWYGHGVGSVA